VKYAVGARTSRKDVVSLVGTALALYERLFGLGYALKESVSLRKVA
jgi:hypothetical protein